MTSSTVIGITNFCFVYLAGIIFVKMVAALGVTDMEGLSEDVLKDAARAARQDTDVKQAMREAKSAYKSARDR